MKAKNQLLLSFLIILAFLLSFISATGQKTESGNYLKGFYLKGSYNTFKKAMLLNWDDRELVFDQDGNMKAFALGYSFIKKNTFWAGLGANVNFSRTGLEPFQARKLDMPGSPSTVDPMLAYNDITSSLLLFDFNGYLVPIKKVPFTLNLGFAMGSGFQKYSVSGDKDVVLNANGQKSKSLFRYGYILGCSIIPFRFVSLDFEFRPMAAYSSTTHYTKLKYLYSDDVYNYYEVLASHKESGPSESFVSLGLSVHF